MIDEYINKVNFRKNKQNLKELYIFGYSFGLFLLLFFTIKYLLNTNNLNNDKFYFLGIICASLVILFTIFYPAALKYPKKIINKFLNFVFFGIFLTLITLIYYICIFPIGIILQIINKKKEDKNISTTFVKKNIFENNNKKSKNIILQILSIFRFFMKKEYLVLLPTIILIILIGLIFIFLQSNIIAPFIYTLF